MLFSCFINLHSSGVFDGYIYNIHNHFSMDSSAFTLISKFVCMEAAWPFLYASLLAATGQILKLFQILLLL